MDIRFGLASTYPPTRCGIATFSASLVAAIQESGQHTVRVVRLVEPSTVGELSFFSADVVSFLSAGDHESMVQAIDVLNNSDVAIVQHEFGIFGGEDGDEVLSILRGLRVPSIVVLHTVLTSPTGHQRSVFTELCARATAIVTMSRVARDRLVSNYLVNSSKISIIPHGARDFSMKSKCPHNDPPIILTWGLLGPGKGIEWAIEAMDLIRDLDPTPHYVIAGRTHPKVFERERESYRESLQSRIDELKLSDSVHLQSQYLTSHQLDELIASSSVVLLPYDSVDQVTSGVLIEAISAWRPIVATRFPQAVELLSGNVGILVPHRNPKELANALRNIFQQPGLAASMSRRTGVLADELLWSSVADRYIRLAQRLIKTMALA